MEMNGEKTNAAGASGLTVRRNKQSIQPTQRHKSSQVLASRARIN